MKYSNCNIGVAQPAYRHWAYETATSFTRPAANIIETATAYVVQLAAPAFRKEDFKISIDKNNLVVSAEPTPTEDKLSFTHQEFLYGKFSRKFVLPENTDKQQITAKYENGILELNIPKVIPVQTNIEIPVL
jgi:HSP20 family protein